MSRLPILVTGANRGIGQESARQLAAAGRRVVLAARRVDEVVAPPGDHVVVQLDVTSAQDRAELVRVVAGLGGLSGVVHNAGVAMSGFDAEIARRTLDVNFHGVRELHAAVAPHLGPGAAVVMVSSGLGALENLGSAGLILGDPEIDERRLCAAVDGFVEDVAAGVHRARGWPSSAYAVSKAALNVLTRILAVRHPALRINAVCPGWVRTRMGGPGASRPVGDGAAGVVWAATLPPDGPTGGFFRDGARIPW
jgi:NAD(P)-dependent dehydrogenase (short-subunit alcohol dehydrogenase family)